MSDRTVEISLTTPLPSWLSIPPPTLTSRRPALTASVCSTSICSRFLPAALLPATTPSRLRTRSSATRRTLASTTASVTPTSSTLVTPTTRWTPASAASSPPYRQPVFPSPPVAIAAATPVRRQPPPTNHTPTTS